jgi:hypothetical protein
MIHQQSTAEAEEIHNKFVAGMPAEIRISYLANTSFDVTAAKDCLEQISEIN